MIGKLKGTVDSIAEEWIILDVNGVGYQVHCSARTLSVMPSVGEPLTLAVETHVREKEIKLFGFINEWEKEWFALLQNVQGVGAKVALAILSTLPTNDLANAIAMQDKAMIARTPGIGAKVAQRIVSELKDKIPQSIGESGGGTESYASSSAYGSQEVQDAISALVNLGYSIIQAGDAVRKTKQENEKEMDSKEIIRLALKELG